MRKIVTSTFVTLDGIMQAPGGPEEDRSGGFEHGGWTVNFWDGMMGQVMDEMMSQPSEGLLGRKTYEIFAAHWPHVTGDPTADKLNSMRKYVVSRTLDQVTWNNSVLIKGDVVSEIKRLKEMDGPNLQVSGSHELLQTLVQHRLVDEFSIWVFPVVIGHGKRLFGESTMPSSLKLVESEVSTTGVNMLRYELVGDIPTGSFALQEPSEDEIARREKQRE